MTRRVTLLTSLMLVLSISVNAQKRAMTTDDILNMTNLGSAIISPEQSLIFFTYLKDIGKVDTQYFFLKREGHGIREPRNQRTRDIEEIKWIQKYARGLKWEPWERKVLRRKMRRDLKIRSLFQI